MAELVRLRLGTTSTICINPEPSATLPVRRARPDEHLFLDVSTPWRRFYNIQVLYFPAMLRTLSVDIANRANSGMRVVMVLAYDRCQSRRNTAPFRRCRHPQHPMLSYLIPIVLPQRLPTIPAHALFSLASTHDSVCFSILTPTLPIMMVLVAYDATLLFISVENPTLPVSGSRGTKRPNLSSGCTIA